MRCLALIVAGGHSARFGTDVPKQYLALGGVPVVRRTVQVFLSHPDVSAVRVVVRAGDEALYREAVAGLELLDPVTGGNTRQESVRRGLESTANEPPDTVLVHDAARPLTPRDVITRVVTALRDGPAAIPALPVQDTLKRQRAEDDLALVGETVDRRGLWRAQTPQGFRYPEILAAHRRFAGIEMTDDAAVAERAGLPVTIVPGDERTMKITTQDDLVRAEGLLAAAAEARIGFGFDVHRFMPGERIILGGVEIPSDKALEGHSDADVVLHAVTDALLGAVAAGDIGQHFPPSDPQWKGAASDQFARHAAEIVRAAGGTVVNVDITVIGEQPRIGPHRGTMVERIAAILGIDPSRVGIKATTTERLGFTGRGEGLAAQAAVSVRLVSM